MIMRRYDVDSQARFVCFFQPFADKKYKKARKKGKQVIILETEGVDCPYVTFSESRQPSMKDLVSLPKGHPLRNVFENHLEDSMAIETFKFFLDAEKYVQLGTQEERICYIDYIYETYIDPNSPYEMHVNHDHKLQLDSVNSFFVVTFFVTQHSAEKTLQ